MLQRYCTTLKQWLRDQLQRWHKESAAPAICPEPLPLNLLATRPVESLPAFVQQSSVALHYLLWFGTLDWANFPERSAHTPDGHEWRGPEPARKAPFVAALLIKLDRSLPHMADLRRFLVEHPALVWVLGFPRVTSAQYPWGFDAAASVPTQREFNRVLRRLPNPALQFLLTNSVALLQAEIPPDHLFGDQISLDTKHIIAWVRENNPKEFIKGGRFHKEKQPKGDKDCKLGFKANGNQSKAKGEAETAVTIPTPTTKGQPASQVRPGDYYWGDASGVVATKVPDLGEFVLAELTQPFDKSEVSYFYPLLQAVEKRLGRRPRFAALDAAFDAFYVYEYFHPTDPTQSGFAAVPLRDPAVRSFDADGLPRCEAGLAMPLKSTYSDHTHLFDHQPGALWARYACPLLFPEKTGETCPIAHKNWAKGGCLATMPTSIGTRIRTQLDRKSDDFQRIYKQRTATERINSQAVELGIERPHLRNRHSIANQNTLLYIILNLRALQRLRIRQPTQPPQA